MTAPSRTRSQLQQSVAEARELGPVAFPHYEMCQRLRKTPSMGLPIEHVAPDVTRGACLDAIEVMQKVYRDNAEKLDLDGSASVETKALVKEQATLCGAISILCKRIGGADAVDNGPDRTSNDDERPAPAGQRGSRS